jgi:hypothetical protein
LQRAKPFPATDAPRPSNPRPLPNPAELRKG